MSPSWFVVIYFIAYRLEIVDHGIRVIGAAYPVAPAGTWIWPSLGAIDANAPDPMVGAVVACISILS